MKKRLLITGAYGLVGTSICNVLNRDYPNIQVTKSKGVENIGQYQSYDYIIHAAGYGQPKKFSEHKIGTVEINTEWLMKLPQLLESDGSFLYVSSSEVYSGAKSPHKETDIGTTTPQHQRACYIEAKRCGEALCGALKESGYNVKIARLALAYGPGTKEGDTRVLNEFIEQALKSGQISMMDKGEALRTYIYAEDAAELMLKILFKGKDHVYNVGGFSETSIAGLASQIAYLTGAKVKLGDKSLVGAPESVKLDMTKTLSEFPMDFVTLPEGLVKTIDYQKELYGIK